MFCVVCFFQEAIYLLTEKSVSFATVTVSNSGLAILCQLTTFYIVILRAIG